MASLVFLVPLYFVWVRLKKNPCICPISYLFTKQSHVSFTIASLMFLPRIPFGLPTLLPLPPLCLLQAPIHPLRPHSISPVPNLLQAKYISLCPAPRQLPLLPLATVPSIMWLRIYTFISLTSSQEWVLFQGPCQGLLLMDVVCSEVRMDRPGWVLDGSK